MPTGPAFVTARLPVVGSTVQSDGKTPRICQSRDRGITAVRVLDDVVGWAIGNEHIALGVDALALGGLETRQRLLQHATRIREHIYVGGRIR
jgi:hypothetical protein